MFDYHVYAYAILFFVIGLLVVINSVDSVLMFIIGMIIGVTIAYINVPQEDGKTKK